MKILNKVEVQSRIHGVWAAVTLYLSSFPSSSVSLNSIESAFVFLVLWHFVNNNLFNSSRFKTMVVWMYNSVDQCCFTTPVECFLFTMNTLYPTSSTSIAIVFFHFEWRTEKGWLLFITLFSQRATCTGTHGKFVMPWSIHDIDLSIIPLRELQTTG